MPRSEAARATRIAISPRLAISSFDTEPLGGIHHSSFGRDDANGLSADATISAGPALAWRIGLASVGYGLWCSHVVHRAADPALDQQSVLRLSHAEFLRENIEGVLADAGGGSQLSVFGGR